MIYTIKEQKSTRGDVKTIIRTVEISDGKNIIGQIEGVFAKDDGHPLYNHEHKPYEVFYVEDEGDYYFHRRHIASVDNIVAGKIAFERWYANQENQRKVYRTPVRALPANPNAEFFPTPSSLAAKMASKVDWNKVVTLLEPSAGKGDLLEYVRKCAGHKSLRFESGSRGGREWVRSTDVIEIDPNLRMILKGKGYRSVADDFLSFSSQKRYDVIIMNPPFSNGDEHLLKAISLQKDDGGQIVCLLNAETIRNPCTSRRKVLAQQLAKYEAQIEFVAGAFKHAERRSDVEVAIVYINIPERVHRSSILENLKRAAKAEEQETAAVEDLVSGNWTDQLIGGYEMEAKAGIALMREYNALAPYIMDGAGDYSKPLLQICINERAIKHVTSADIDTYLRGLRYKYWSNLLSHKELTEKMTSALRREYQNKVEGLKDYDFSEFNIRQVMLDISAQLSRGVEESISALFDELSAEHAWYPECRNNIHYFSGWATNKAHRVGMKVILPIDAFFTHYDGKKELRVYEFAEKICDIERALNYLDRGDTTTEIDPYSVAQFAQQMGQTKMHFKYFEARFYKKGTCHLKFHESAARLIDRLNIFAARKRQWLPPDYGKRRYDDMDEKSKAVIDEFQGREAYERVMDNPEQYIISPGSSLPMLTSAN